MLSQKLELYKKLKEKSVILGRTFLTRYEITLITKENEDLFHIAKVTEYLDNLEQDGKIKIMTHDITLFERIKMYHLK